MFAGGYYPTSRSDVIDFVTIASTGDATDFGDLGATRMYSSAVSSSTRFVIGGGAEGSIVNKIEFTQFSTTGNAVDFGDLTQARRHLDACSNGHGGL